MTLFPPQKLIPSRWLLACVLVVFGGILGYLIMQKAVMGDTLTYTTDFSTGGSRLYGPYPKDRVTLVDGNDGEKVLRVVGEPVYITAYSPREFTYATVTLTYQKPANVPVQLGIRRASNEWSFSFQPFPATDTGWNTTTFTFPLADIESEKNRLQFIISAPRIGEYAEPLLLKAMSVTLYK